MGSVLWKVVPLCTSQLADIRSSDILNGGLYRICNTYRGGGGYDKFPKIWEERSKRNVENIEYQFVVQLYGCPLRCPYCYVTPDGVHGKYEEVSTKDMLSAFTASGAGVFHLMGGAPALYLHKWKEIAENVAVFHSDFLLVENLYNEKYLKNLPGLHAVSMKDLSVYSEDQLSLIIPNLKMLLDCEVNFYITFTGEGRSMENVIRDRFGDSVLKDSFRIPVIKYEAIKRQQ